LQKSILLKKQELVDSTVARVTGKKGGPKMKVSLTMLLKTNGEKMSVCGLETMLLKTIKLYFSSNDVYEKKGERRWTRGREKYDQGAASRGAFKPVPHVKGGGKGNETQGTG
jgi:hypothetical protein